MSKKNRLIVHCLIALCSQYVCAQPRTMGLEEMFRPADENSQRIQVYQTGKDAAEAALQAAKAQRLPDINASLSASYLGDGKLWDRDFSNPMNIDMPHFGNNFSLEAQQVIYAGGAISSSIELAELGKHRTRCTKEPAGSPLSAYRLLPGPLQAAQPDAGTEKEP